MQYLGSKSRIANNIATIIARVTEKLFTINCNVINKKNKQLF